jgi:hypothetical protein
MYSVFVNTVAFQFAPLLLDISICALWVAVLGNLSGMRSMDARTPPTFATWNTNFFFFFF